MQVARLEIRNFRGYESTVLLPGKNALIAGEPRAGRSDLIAALRRVLDPGSTRVRPNEWDVHRPVAGNAADDDADGGAAEPATTIEVSLLGLTDETEQRLQDRLELLDPATGQGAPAAADDAVLGVRLRYCLSYNRDEQALEHWVDYPRSGLRAPRAERELLRAFVLDRNPPLQLRAEGALRRLAHDADPDALQSTLDAFAERIADATQTLAASDEVQAALTAVVNHGARRPLQLDPADPTAAIGFTAEDGSLSALLRAVQPTLYLDPAGPLPLSSHGSTATAIIATAEAGAGAGLDDAILLCDDFGDQLDAASAEYLAARLRRRRGQLWMTTRRPEVLRAFEPEELIRLTRSGGKRAWFALSPTQDRKERVRRRHLHPLLASALTARTAILVEGPHDLDGYSAVAWRLFAARNTAPLAAYGMRIVPASASGGDGGKQQLPGLAQLAAQLGFAVRVVLDHDKPGTDDDLIADLATVAEMIVRLPERAAVERALVDGLAPAALRAALEVLNDDHDLGLDLAWLADPELADKCVWALKQKSGLHNAFVDALPTGVTPPLAAAVLQQLKGAAPDGPLIDLDEV